MLKRLSATFAANNANEQYSSGQATYGSSPSMSASANLGVPEGNQNSSSGSGYGSNYAYGALSPGPGHGYPRPSGQSTPFSESSQPNGYFPTQIQQPSSHRLPSPLPSPAFGHSATSIQQAQPPQYRAIAQTTVTATKPIAPLPPIDRLTLQKSLKGLETLLVAMDEYRELNTRLGKVEKRLAKNAKELAASMVSSDSGTTGTKATKAGSSGSDAAASQSIVSALVSTSTLFEILSETNSKFTKACQKEYDSINELCGKYFKKIAKEEAKHDEVLENLDNKLKKANFAYDKQRVARSGHNNTAFSLQNSGAHEQFVPLLSQLTEDITKARFNHGSSMANRRDVMIREVARSMTNFSDLEFKRACECVKKTGAEIGHVLAAQALLGEKADKGDMVVMPSNWPPELQDYQDYDAAMPTESIQTQNLPYQSQQEGNVHPAHWSAQHVSQQPPQQAYQDLKPPRPVVEQYGSVRSARSDTSRRSSQAFSSRELQQSPRVNSQQPFPSSRVSSAAPSPRIPHRELAPASLGNDSPPDNGSRRVSFSQAPDRDIDATVVARSHPAKPALDTSFSPYVQQQKEGYRGEPSPPLKQSPLARQPDVQTPSLLQHAVSQRGNVGYFDNERNNSGSDTVAEDLTGDRSGNSQAVYNEGTVRKVTMPSGFVIDETEMSPDKPLRSVQDLQDRPKEWQTSQILDYGGDESPVSSTLPNSREHGQGENEGAGRRQGGADLERSASVDSTASQQSFVARMKLKYVQDKEARHDSSSNNSRASASPPTRRPLPAPTHSASSSTSSGSVKVSSIAQKYEQASSSGTGSSQLPHGRNASLLFGQAHPSGTVRPAHTHRQSLPVMPGYSSRNDPTSHQQLRFADSPRQTSSSNLRNRSAENLIREEEEQDSPHPAMCACEDCSVRGYDTTGRNGGGSRAEGGRVVSEQWNDATVRSNRRVSMPLPVSMASGR